MENLSSVLDAESPSLPREVIEEVKTVRRANLIEDEQMQELRMIAHRNQIPEVTKSQIKISAPSRYS